ncbi:uncharacterized protein LOC115753995 [Rhodamnia argentea]|uniref:Uncharacterized protein LOC115753995 n=1 Tax=Rhodamnia argentea TaxID=178133 RepID=A0A8B8QR33_9MYRT|nr:uncharacterized protein LOC115753995 [Rhodamnia argentea]
MVSHHTSLQSSMATIDLDRHEDEDVYYAELKRQILELTAEEDQDEGSLETRHVARAYNDAMKASPSACAKGLGHFNSWEKRNPDSSVPSCIWSSWQKSNGTGVFIPNIVKSRTRHASDQSASYERKKIYRQVDQSENSKYLSATWRSKREMRLSS